MRCIRVNAEPGEPGTAAQVTQLFSRLHALTELEIAECELVGHALRAAPSLRQVTVDLVWLGPRQNCHRFLLDIIGSCSAAFTIRSCKKSHVPILCAGLEASATLTDLTLSQGNGYFDKTDTAAILESLQRNSILVRFALDLILSATAAEQVAEPLLAYLRNLRRNERLKILSLRLGNDTVSNEVNASISGEIVEMLLLHFNTTLQQIEGLTYESVEDERRIRRLLLLNRYGVDFVANATSVPLKHWGDVLMSIGTEDCNYFVTKLVKRAVEGREFQKRPHRLPKQQISARKMCCSPCCIWFRRCSAWNLVHGYWS